MADLKSIDCAENKSKNILQRAHFLLALDSQCVNERSIEIMNHEVDEEEQICVRSVEVVEEASSIVEEQTKRDKKCRALLEEPREVSLEAPAARVVATIGGSHATERLGYENQHAHADHRHRYPELDELCPVLCDKIAN